MDSWLVLIANSKDGTISSFELADGGLTPLGLSEVGGVGGMPLAVDESRGLIYAGTSEPAAINVLRLDRATGTLTQIASHPTQGKPVYLALTSDGGLLFSASYHQGLGEAWRVGDDGALSSVGQTVHYPNLHSLALSSDDAFAYFVSLRDDLIAQYAVAADGRLTPLDPPTVPAPAGSGPRHLVLDAAETSVYVNTEFSGEALQYRRDPATGRLTEASRAACVPADRGLAGSRFGADPRAEELIWGSDLHLDAWGRRLYCAERTRATITAVAVGEDGTLGPALAHSDVVAQPRSFAILPNDDLLVASEIDRMIGVYRADDDGALTEIARHEVGQGANWIEVISR